MPSSFEKAGPEVEELAAEIITLHHADLDTVGAKIDFLMAFRDPEKEEPALMLRGHRAAGIASIHAYQYRVLGCGDALVKLDGDEWSNMSLEQKQALVDHEITHFEAKRDKLGEFLFDDLNRPQLKMRVHDREIGWFDSIALRYGMASFEVKQFASLLSDEAGQSYLRFIDSEVAKSVEAPIKKLQRLPKEGVSISKVTISGGGHSVSFGGENDQPEAGGAE